MLHQLTQIPKLLITVRTTIRKIRNCTIPRPSTSILQHWRVRQISIHSRPALLRSKVINLSTCILLRTTTSGTISAFSMLHGISSGFEFYLTTNKTCDCFGSMNLHMHIELILGGEFSAACVALVGDDGGRILLGLLRSIWDTRFASWVSISFEPLIATEARIGLPISTVGTVSSHSDSLSKYYVLIGNNIIQGAGGIMYGRGYLISFLSFLTTAFPFTRICVSC